MNSTVTIGSPDRKTPGLAWHDRAPELAKWARRYFVRRDRYGGYHRKDNATRPFTKPRDGPEEDCVTVELLERHFRATGTDDVIGAHPLAPGEGGRWAAVDIDAHGEAADPAANERFARAVHGEAAALGLHPLTYESNGKGGYHVVVFFDAKAPDLVPGPILHSFVRWLVRRHAEFGFAKPPETFPKQPTVPADGYGNWFRLVGRHHTRDHWPRVWDGTEWHSGADAVGYVLGIPRDDHALIPLEAIVDAMEPDSPPRPTPGGDGRPGDDFDRRGGERAIRELLIRHGWTHSRDRGDGVSEWTRPGKADGCSATLGFCRGLDGVPMFYCWTTGAPPLEAGRAYTPFALLAALDHGGDYRVAAVALRARGFGGATSEPGAADAQADGRPPIVIGTDEYRVNDEAAAALAAERDLYQRGRMLVHVVATAAEPNRESTVRRPVGAPFVSALSGPGLRERLTRCARWVHQVDGEPKPAHPPGWAVQAVLARGEWPDVRRLEALVNHPVILRDGSILATNGYDASSGLLLHMPAALAASVPDRPSASDADDAVGQLLDVVSDFPFARPEHRAAWVASVLTPLAWFAFEGPAPWFVIDKNVRGAGAGLLADVAALVVTGRRFPVMAYTSEREELRKRITSAAAAGDRMVLLDNLAGPVGNEVLDAALTSEWWKDRLLGGNRMYDGPLHVCWYGTGNNVQLQADTARRVCHVRMESAEERPELRDGFRYPDLRAHVLAERGRLLSAALTILRRWFAAGRPRNGLTPWGSFEGWSGLVREAVVFAGLPDPGETRLALQTTADRDAAVMTALLVALVEMDTDGRGVTVAEIIDRIKTPSYPMPEWLADLRAAVEELCGRLDGRALGYRFRQFQRRNFDGRMLDKASATHGTGRWVVRPATGIRGG